MQVSHVGALLAENAREPRHVARAERAPQVRDRVLPHRPAIADGEPGALEHRRERAVRREERHDVLGAALLGPRREVDEQPLGAPDVPRDDHVNDAKASLLLPLRSASIATKQGQLSQREHACQMGLSRGPGPRGAGPLVW